MILGQDKKTSRVYVLSEIGFDTDFFNEQAFNNLLEFIRRDKYTTGILLDGALTRLDRPEILNELLSYWNKTETECDDASLSIPYHKQYQHMLAVQMDILRNYLLKIKRAAPKANIVLCIPTDDTHFSLSALIAELLRYRKSEISETIKLTTLKIKKSLKIITDAEKKLKNITEKDTKIDQQRQLILKKIIERKRRYLSRLKGNLETEQASLLLFRTKKSRPEHQQRTHEFVRIFLKSYADLCNELKITLVTRPAVLKFGNMIIDYAHSRHHTWTVVKGRDKQFVVSKHGKLGANEINKLVDITLNDRSSRPETEIEDIAQKIKVEQITLEKMLSEEETKKNILKEAKKKRVDIVLETGHHGIGFKQTQKIADIPETINFKNQASYSPIVAEDHITFVMSPSFEDQRAISAYRNGKKPARMKLGIPLNTTSHEAFKRYDNGAVSGICILQKNISGLIQTEWIQYENFIAGAVLKQPDAYVAIFASSDEHKGSPEENLIAQDGFIKTYKDAAQRAFTFRGKPARGGGYINGGDVGEANSRKWSYRYQRRPDPQNILLKIIASLIKIDNKNQEEVHRLSLDMMSYALAGSVESMRDILQRIANYFTKFFEISLKHSLLRHIHVSVPGNHVDEVLRDLGLKDTDFFVERLQAQGHSVYEVGIDRHFSENEDAQARVFVGGYSNARIINIKEYGLDVNNKPLFGPINLLVQHDPKGSGFTGIIDAGKSANADLVVSGHTHENYLKLYKTGDNKFSVAYRLATLQGVTPTEKYYAGSVPRTQAGHWLIIPMQGDIAEMAIPVHFLMKIGHKNLKELIQNFLKKPLK